MSIVIAGRMPIKQESVEEAREQGAALASKSREEAGCLDYRFGFDAEEPNVALIQEHWESEDALNAHMGAAHFQAFTGFIIGVVDGPVDLKRHEVTESRPLFG